MVVSLPDRIHIHTGGQKITKQREAYFDLSSPWHSNMSYFYRLYKRCTKIWTDCTRLSETMSDVIRPSLRISLTFVESVSFTANFLCKKEWRSARVLPEQCLDNFWSSGDSTWTTLSSRKILWRQRWSTRLSTCCRSFLSRLLLRSIRKVPGVLHWLTLDKGYLK